VSDRDDELNGLLQLMARRRVCRAFRDQPVDTEELAALVRAARLAPSASNQRINKFLVVDDPVKIQLLRQVSPGMLGMPTALIVILTDRSRADEVGVRLDRDPRTRWADVGAAAENVLLAAEALGLGACPLMSFSVGGAASILELPDHLVPDYIIQLGHRAAAAGTDDEKTARESRD
jgi:nitroreductase